MMYIGDLKYVPLINNNKVTPASPDHYDAEIEYLESSGTLWINTKINCNSRYILEVKVKGASSTEGILGARTAPTGNSRHTIVFPGPPLADTVRYVCGNLVFSSIDFSLFNLYKADYNKFYINNTLAATVSARAFTLDYPYYLFALNTNKSVTNLGPKKIKMCKIWDGESLLIHLIPVRVGQVGYMYDKVSGRLFGNQGTGEFILGPDINT